MGEWTIGAVLDAIADVVPDRTMTVCGNRRSTFGESADRTRRFANFLASNGFGAHRERDELERWECGQDRVALIMHNDLYPDMVVGCLKARTVPVNVNYNYTPREIHELLSYIKARAVIYHRSLGSKFADVLPADRYRLAGVDRRRKRGARTFRRRTAGCGVGARGYRSHVGSVAGRRDNDLHRRHHRPSQGRVVAAIRHVRAVDEWRRPCVRRGDSRYGAQRWLALVRCVAADACGRDVDRFRGDHERAAGDLVRQSPTSSIRGRSSKPPNGKGSE